jgi:hypothetical protein
LTPKFLFACYEDEASKEVFFTSGRFDKSFPPGLEGFFYVQANTYALFSQVKLCLSIVALSLV